MITPVGNSNTLHLDLETLKPQALELPLELPEMSEAVVQALAAFILQPQLSLKPQAKALAADIAQTPTLPGVAMPVTGVQQRSPPVAGPVLSIETPLPAIPAPARAPVLEADSERAAVPGAVLASPVVVVEPLRPVPGAAQSALAGKPSLPTQPPAAPMLPIAPASTRAPGEGLRVPFNNGRVSGSLLVTGSESTPGMLLTPSNSLLLEQLREPLARLEQPAWRLAERAGEHPQERGQPSRDELDDEQEDPR
ncbi:hypothetical protein PS652_01146 [Pseudomonas fluorescens]|uniref:Type III secretion effector protein n=2 Tax=Pseudomonas TaxID=286 RepID=A0A5E6QUE8_PSEFL|nr:hypothetical protein PS652_01196 [Pseudomonas fluorescens]